jgi:predicted aldo/keto reductase-like oxidoreductase
MKYRRFGRTELAMPVFSCGGMRYQHDWKDVPLADIPAESQANLEATIHRSIELGINHIETAHGYGSSERQLGLVLPKFDRDKLIVQTKVAPSADPQEFRKTFEESLARLQLDHVDLLGLHGINNYELFWQSTRPGGCLAEARKLVAEGKVRHVGFSTHGSLDVILDTIRHEADGGFDYVNLHWYYIFQQNWPAVAAAKDRDMGLFIISPADKGGMLYSPPKRLTELCAPLHPLVFNCLYCLARPEIHTLSLGAAQPSDFDLQCSSLDFDPSDPLVEEVTSRLNQAMEAAVGKEVADRFAEGLPAWEATPGNLNLPVMIWLRNLVEAFDLTDYAKMRYNLLGGASHWFPGMNYGDLQGRDLTPALAKSPFAGELEGWLAEIHERLYEAPKKRLSES